MRPSIYIRFAAVSIASTMIAAAPALAQSFGKIDRLDDRVNALIPSDAKLEIVAQGFEWSEGPVWVREGGYLLFSDVPRNTIHKWKASEGLSVYLRPSGYAGDDPPGLELGTNGLALDRDGNLVFCDHGNRCVSRLNASNFTRTILASKYEGKRLNSPNDLVIKSNGDLYFTDPPYGLKGLNQDANKELEFNGVYRLSTAGELTLLTKTLTFPNGIAFSPDEKTMYVANSDPQKAIWMAYNVLDDGTLGDRRVFFDAMPWVNAGKKGLPDGMAVDQAGNLFATGPGGVHIFSPDGSHLGTIDTGEATANCAFGEGGQALYITADMLLCRIALSTKGLGF